MAVDSPTAFDNEEAPLHANKLIIEPEEDGEDDEEEEVKKEEEPEKEEEEPVLRNASLSMAQELADDEENKAGEDGE